MDALGAQALVELGRWLRASGYRFVTVTPETHRRVIARPPPQRPSLRDIFGHNRPFALKDIASEVVDLLSTAGALRESAQGYQSAVRFSSLGIHLFAHSAFPTNDVDAVFFGPDTYRFCGALQRASLEASCVVDVGCGSGAGGIVCALPGRRVVLADINDQALAFARVNVRLAGLEDVEILNSDVLANVDGPIDLVIANPPYLRDDPGRTYRDGGGAYGEAIAARIVSESVARLRPGGTLILYTGSAIVDGRDTFLEEVTPVLGASSVRVRYEELDPDVFGEELASGPYQAAERIAAVLLTVTRL